MSMSVHCCVLLCKQKHVTDITQCVATQTTTLRTWWLFEELVDAWSMIEHLVDCLLYTSRGQAFCRASSNASSELRSQKNTVSR